MLVPVVVDMLLCQERELNPHCALRRDMFSPVKLPRQIQWECLGTDGGTRTPNLLVRSQTLYPLELHRYGAPGGNRTHTPWVGTGF